MPKRLAELDYLRGYAVAMVIAFHFILGSSPQSNGLHDFLGKVDLGTGVDLFFVISGFVISAALHELWNVTTVDEAKRQTHAVVLFYAKRFLRLWPAMVFWLWANVLLAAVLSAAGTKIMPPAGDVVRKALAGMVYLYNFEEYSIQSSLGYFWSLSVEWQFYVVLPLLLLLVRDMVWRLVLLVLAVAAFLYFMPGGGGWWMFRFFGLVVGIVFYVINNRLGVTAPRVSLLSRGWARALTTLVLLAAIALSARFTQSLAIGLVLSSMVGGVLVWFAAANNGFVSCFGMRPVVDWAGSRSYSLYLCHIPANALAAALLLELGLRQPSGSFGSWTPAYYLVSVACAVVFAEMTYRLIEKPSHAASRRLTLDDIGYPDARSQTEVAAANRPA